MPLSEYNDITYWGNEEPLCPHCDTPIDLGEPFPSLYVDGEQQHLDCPECKKKFLCQSSCTWKFSTDDSENLDHGDGGDDGD